MSLIKLLNKYLLSCGPGLASGWYCTEKTGLFFNLIPSIELSNNDRWVISVFFFKLSL